METTNETKLLHVKLTDITVSSTNVMFRDETELTQDALQELVDSVREKGVIQPVLLRPAGKDKYTLVCGERRYRASQFIKTETIPAYIRGMTDEEAFELQVIENLQRKDVHPLREAKAYKFLIDKDGKNTTAELALRFGKSEAFIVQRLKLNDLIPAAKRDFQDNMMSLGHALLLARLTTKDQEEVIDECSRSHSHRKDSQKYYDTVHKFQDYINRHVICNLSSATFKKDDPSLVPKAGPCTTCLHRSGASPQLFADVKEKDRCFNKACFEEKNVRHLANQIDEVLSSKPDVLILKTYGELHPDIEKLLKSKKVKVHESYKDYYTYESGGPKAKGLYVTGEKAGHFETVYLKKNEAAKPGGDPAKTELKEAIGRIQERVKRSAELDQEKVYVKILEKLEKHEAFTKVGRINSFKMDDWIVAFLIHQHVSYSSKVNKMFGLPESYYSNQSDKYLAALQKLDRTKLIALARVVLLEKFAGQADTIHRVPGKLLYKFAKELGDVPVSEYEKMQTAERVKREARANERIKALKTEKTQADEKKENKAKPKKKTASK